MPTFQGLVGATVTAVEAMNRVVDLLQELEASVDRGHCEIAIFRRLQPLPPVLGLIRQMKNCTFRVECVASISSNTLVSVNRLCRS